MAICRDQTEAHLKKVLSRENLQERMSPNHTELPPELRFRMKSKLEHCLKRWELTKASQEKRDRVLSADAIKDIDIYQKNIENYIGTVQVPVGLAGPLRVNGAHAQGDYYVPLATTEAALVASYNRGAQLISAAGGCTAIVISQGISRTPCFLFKSVIDASHFIAWVMDREKQLKSIAESTTRHGKLQSIKAIVEGNAVYLDFEYYTGNAAGQNMVTIATQAAYEFILEQCPIKSTFDLLEGNFSSDKKASHRSLQHVRGKKVVAELTIPNDLLMKKMRVSSKAMEQLWRRCFIGGVMAGYVGSQAHFANGIAAVYLACGQDVACVAESAIGITRYEVVENDALYVAVTLPNIVVGVLGGGTGLPTQSACLEALGIDKNDEHGSQIFAEIIAATCLAGEISLCAALCDKRFAKAHARLARSKLKGS